ncbi:DUF1579 family protein [Robertkochia sediminum]|uniref:DUF1579 family protein n=1 Tax=Robertkochia sediminum TaxID=2785326 RepID=UPI001933BF73|nr:DUF1579 family protein [Robertkochia sediminum]MBL7472034.1 DUF1579 family protein [Robertkochia sediminum]
MKQLHQMVHITAILVCMAFTSGTYAQTETDTTASLHFLSGTWEVRNFARENDTWKLLGTTKSTGALEHDGRFVSERTKFLTPFGTINMITFIGFDSKAKKFKLSAMDKEYGLMDIYLGGWTNNALVFDNLSSDLPVKTEDGKHLHFRLTYKDITERSFTHLVEGTTDQGKSWFIFSRSVFNKAP